MFSRFYSNFCPKIATNVLKDAHIRIRKSFLSGYFFSILGMSSHSQSYFLCALNYMVFKFGELSPDSKNYGPKNATQAFNTDFVQFFIAFTS